MLCNDRTEQLCAFSIIVRGCVIVVVVVILLLITDKVLRLGFLPLWLASFALGCS
jgi:predicted RND superfamily exporter protein